MTAYLTTKELFEHADELISAAEHELDRAEEDVVIHLVCNNARLSISHCLIGFLLEKNIPIRPPASIASLQQQCQSIDPRFRELDLDQMACRYQAPGSAYCLEGTQHNACLKAAQQVHDLVLAEMPAY
jgi:hypothetical protein